MDYPTSTDIFKKMIELKEANSVIYRENKDDLESFVYEAIEDLDDACENDIKDGLIDEVIDIMDGYKIDLEELDNRIFRWELEAALHYGTAA